MIFVYDDEFLNIKIYDDIPDIREGKPKEIIEIPDIMDAWEFYKKLVRCKECKKSHIDGKTTHYLWCVEWGRSTDTFGYCERGEREGE